MASPLSRSSLNRNWKLYAGAAAVLAVLAAAAAPSAARAASAAAATAAPAPSTLTATPLGVNVAPWDYAYYQSGSVKVMQPLLKAAGMRQFRYGGGADADAYNWQTNTTITGCLPYNATASFTSSCAATEPLNFNQFSLHARAIGASSFVTVNYGSGTPAQAAAWVKRAKQTPSQVVALWEVGNENYGCWEVNNELSGSPEYFKNYVPGIHNSSGQNPTCPPVTQGIATGMQTLATSYAVNALQFLTAMKAANPAAQIGVPWAFSGDVGGASVAGSGEWNRTVLGTDGKYVSFVDAHYYPFGFGGTLGGSNPTSRQVLQALFQVPNLYGEIRNQLHAYGSTASIVVGETGVSNHPTMTTCTPVGALFAAGDVLSWLAAGAKSVDWWDMNNYGNTGSTCVASDQGMFTSSAKPIADTPYYGYLLASMLAQPHAQLVALATNHPAYVLAYRAVLPNGKKVVALINTNTDNAERVQFKSGLSGTLQRWTYAARNQNSTNSKIVTGTAAAATVAKGITLPVESITILKTR
jgi:hypothetical protein